MSRCFSYPPPGYSVSQGSSQALIDSIKLQKENELAKAESKKDRKREKKERKKEKKEKSKSHLVEKKIHKSSPTSLKFTSLQALLQSENEQLERSSLTEEHAKPVGEQKPSTSSDSTQNSSKRKRDASPPAVARQEENSIRSNGNVIRIRLSSQKKKVVSQQEPCLSSQKNAVLNQGEQRLTTSSQEQDAAISRQQSCSTSGRTEFATHTNHQDGQVGISSIRQGINNIISVHLPIAQVDNISSASKPKSVIIENGGVLSQLPENKLPKLAPIPPRPAGEGCSTTVEAKSNSLDGDIAFCFPKSLDKKNVKADFRYRDLFLNWVPPPLLTELESDGEDWLFSKKKNPDIPSEKKLKPSSNVFRGSSSALWPTAQFIPEADIYALPFTVPF